MAKILVVEDEPLIRLGLVGMLEEVGFETLQAGSAADAIQLLERRLDINLIITDVDMPGSMDGAKLAHYVRDRWPPIRLIVVSGKVLPPQVALPPGTPYFSKPFRDQLMLDTIAGLLRPAAPDAR